MVPTGVTDTIALILAGGTASESLGAGPKALVPVGSRPMIEYVVGALRASGCPCVYVFHEAGVPLDERFGADPGVFTIARGPSELSYADGILHALTTVAQRHPADDLLHRTILYISCDVPLVTPDDLQSLVSRFRASDTDLCLFLAEADQVLARWPGRKLARVSLSDRPAGAVQPVVCLRGSLAGVRDGRLAFGVWSPCEAERIIELIRKIRERRRSAWLVRLLVYREVLRRIDSPSTAFALVRAVVAYATGRMSTGRLLHVVDALARLRVGLIDSDRFSLSIDVDSPADLQFVIDELDRRSTVR